MTYSSPHLPGGTGKNIGIVAVAGEIRAGRLAVWQNIGCSEPYSTTTKSVFVNYSVVWCWKKEWFRNILRYFILTSCIL